MKTIIIFLALLISCATDNQTSEEYYFDKILTLPDNVYESISLTCGDGASNKDLWEEYESSQALYDSLPFCTIYINK